MYKRRLVGPNKRPQPSRGEQSCRERRAPRQDNAEKQTMKA